MQFIFAPLKKGFKFLFKKAHMDIAQVYFNPFYLKF